MSDDQAQAALDRHAVAIASVRALGLRSGAERIVLLIDEGEKAPATVLEWAPGSVFELTERGVAIAVPPEGPGGAQPIELPGVRPVPATAVEADPELGELAAPIGAIASLATAVLALAAGFGGRSVATAEYPTRDPDRPLAIAARPGEAIVVAVGEAQFAFPEGWPEGV